MTSRISQAYGYGVCFITVIVMLIGIKQVVDAAFDLSDRGVENLFASAGDEHARALGGEPLGDG